MAPDPAKNARGTFLLGRREEDWNKRQAQVSYVCVKNGGRLLHLVVVAATAGVSRPVADAARLRTAGEKIAHGQQPSGVTLDKNEMA